MGERCNGKVGRLKDDVEHRRLHTIGLVESEAIGQALDHWMTHGACHTALTQH